MSNLNKQPAACDYCGDPLRPRNTYGKEKTQSFQKEPREYCSSECFMDGENDCINKYGISQTPERDRA